MFRIVLNQWEMEKILGGNLQPLSLLICSGSLIKQQMRTSLTTCYANQNNEQEKKTSPSQRQLLNVDFTVKILSEINPNKIPILRKHMACC